MKFDRFAEYLERIDGKSSRLEMTSILAELFKKVKTSEIKPIVYFVQGEIAPSFTGLDLGVGEKFILQAVSISSGYDLKRVTQVYKKKGDFGSAAEELMKKKRQQSFFSQTLPIDKVYGKLVKLAQAGGRGSQTIKIKAVAELFTSLSPLSAKYVARFVNGTLRLGVGGPTIIDAFSFALAEDKSLRDEIERAYNMSSDLGMVGELVFTDYKKIKKFSPKPFYPIRPALAERLKNSEDIYEKLGNCLVDSKYDGFRLQLHKKGDKIEIYSRKGEKMTHMFPEIVDAVKKIKAKELILDSEAIAYDKKSKKYLPFQQTIQRKRKYGISKMKDELPLNAFVFDILYLNGKDLTLEPFKKRRKIIEKMFSKKDRIRPSEAIYVKNAKQIEKYFQLCLKQGLEGVIAKDLEAPYVAGARKFAWIKLKKSYGLAVDTVDVVIAGYYKGKGHRAQFEFGGLLTVVYNKNKERFETIARVGSGFTEEQMVMLKKILGEIEIKEKPKGLDSDIKPDHWVRMKYVITVAFDEITKSPMHTCCKKEGKGFALRFPRMIELREDKGIYDATTSKEIKSMYGLQY